MAQSKVWVDELNLIETKTIDTIEAYEEALRINNVLKQSMSDSYEFVSSDSKHLLNCLQRTPSGDSREEKARSRLSDYTDAASHVMDVIVVLYEQNKQLVILWEKQKVRVGQKYKLSLYEQKSNEVRFLYFLFLCVYYCSYIYYISRWHTFAMKLSQICRSGVEG